MPGVTNINCMFISYHGLVKEIDSIVSLGTSYVPGKTNTTLYDIEMKAVWDTGAMGTSISKELAQKLGLVQSGETWVEGVTGGCESPLYLVSLHLPNMVTIPELEVCELEGNIGCDVLIGMDVITMGDFAICNKDGKTTFSFRVPSGETVNFTRPGSYGQAKGKKIMPNTLCPCRSGKKYKKCCGAPGAHPSTLEMSANK